MSNMNLKFHRGTYEIKGVTVTDKGLQFVWKGTPSFLRAEIVFFANKEEVGRVLIPDTFRQGSLYSVIIEDLPANIDGYVYMQNGIALADVYAQVVDGLRTYGEFKDYDQMTVYKIPGKDFEWDNDVPLKTPLHKSIIYGMHVRGFTKSPSSGVSSKNRGTFAGITEKISYLKELGITAIELMPAYEYDEMYRPKERLTADKMLRMFRESTGDKEQNPEQNKQKPNYWGFMSGYYFAPKSAYAASTNPEVEFKTMVKKCHEAGIEVILQFFFDGTLPIVEMLDILHHWVREYHVDGFRFVGTGIPLSAIGTDPYLADTKLISSDFPLNEVYRETMDAYNSDAVWRKRFKNIGIINSDFEATTRRVLKGEGESLEHFFGVLRDNGYNHASIHGMDDFAGFNLMDLVSYEYKHNEDNGENNQDGRPYEISWNCGAEGPTRKKTVLELRQRQIKNALAMIFTAQGTPYIRMGDEFGHSQKGNNNPYNQDNATNWVNWKLTNAGKDLLDFTKRLIAFRKQGQAILSQRGPVALMDTLSCGYPDVSYHGEHPWQADLSAYQSFAGILFYGAYGASKEGGEEKGKDSYYIIYNLHWDAHNFDLPKLKNAGAWEQVLFTGSEEVKIGDNVVVPGRSVLILKCK